MDNLRSFELLERVFPRNECGGFMFMGTQGEIYLYKHGITRRYLNLSDDGRGFVNAHVYDNKTGKYTSRPLDAAIQHVVGELESMGFTRSTAYNAEFRAERDRELAKLGYKVAPVSLEDGPAAAEREIDKAIRALSNERGI